MTSNQEGALIIAREMPTALRNAAPEDRLGVALAQILLHWGTTDPEFDLDGDGTVGVGDIERAGLTSDVTEKPHRRTQTPRTKTGLT